MPRAACSAIAALSRRAVMFCTQCDTAHIGRLVAAMAVAAVVAAAAQAPGYEPCCNLLSSHRPALLIVLCTRQGFQLTDYGLAGWLVGDVHMPDVAPQH